MQEALWAASQLKEVKGKNYGLVVGFNFLQPFFCSKVTTTKQKLFMRI